MSVQVSYIDNESRFQEIPAIQQEATDYLQQTPNDPNVSRFVFMRHGESENNKSHKVGGQTDNSGLSERGMQQALEKGEKLARIQFDAFYSSPLKRAKQTIALVQEQLHQESDIIEADSLKEKHFGPFENQPNSFYKTYQHLQKKGAGGPDSSFEEKFSYKPDPAGEELQEYSEEIRSQFETIESYEQVAVRVDSFVQDHFQSHLGQTVLATSHQVAMKTFMMKLLYQEGVDLDYGKFELENCSMLVVEVDALGRARLVATEGASFKE